MADESLDVDVFDGGDGEVVQGSGGYVDDDIDLDDDDDDEPLVSSTPRANSSATPSKTLKRRVSTEGPKHVPEAKRRKVSSPHPNDFLLRASGVGDLRDFIVAKFATRTPDLVSDPHVRLYRKTEPTTNARKEAVEAHRKQQIFYKSFAGKRKVARYEKQGIVIIPDRYRHGWTMEVTPKHIIEQRKASGKTGVVSGMGQNGAGVNAPGNPDTGAEKPPVDPNVDVFEGKFDGKSTSRYAIMVLSKVDKTVDVIPIDEYGWVTFRASYARALDTTESVEAKMAKVAKKGENRMSRFQVKYEEAQGLREQNMGDNSRIKNSKDFASFGIRRGKAKREGEDEEGKEELDFEHEFDNDDVAQIDKESVEKNETRVLGDAEQNAKDFRKLIKDEPITSRPASPGSESEEEPAQRRSPQPQTQSPSNSRPPSSSRSPKRSTKPSPPGTSRNPTPRGSSPSGMTPFGVTPSPGRSPSNKLDLSHLMPPPGVLPTAHHAKAVLTVLLQNKDRIRFKEFMQHFDHKGKHQKQNLIKVLREVAIVTADPTNPKNFFISLKKNTAPSGLPTGR